MKFTLHSGILSESRSKTLIKEFIKVSFSHKTVQEFFAAIFISSQNDAQKTVLESCKNIQDILDMSIICEFISKMNADRMCAISNDMMSVINEDEKTRDYRTSTADQIVNFPLYKIQTMLMSCLQEMPESENIQLCLQDFFIDNKTVDSKQLQRLSKQNKNNIKSLNIVIRSPALTRRDCELLSITYRCYTPPSLREIIDLFSLTGLSHIQKLFYDGESKESEINLILFPSLQSITLLCVVWISDEENPSDNLAQCQNVQYLFISHIWFSHKILETFLNFISCQKSMKDLTLNNLKCKEHRDHIWNLDLSQCLTLKKLFFCFLGFRLQLNITTPSLVYVKMAFTNLDESSLLLSCDMLNIERVKLLCVAMSAESLQNFITVLENLPQSVTVNLLTAIEPETEYERVKENIRRSQNFHVIRNADNKREVFKFKTLKPSENRNKTL
jgi:hypothetical protein